MFKVFCLGGLLCVAFQLLRSFFETVPPPKLNVLGFIFGGIMTPLGLCDALSRWGNWGIGVTVISGGNASANAFYQLMHGNFIPIIATLCLYIAIFLVGYLAGYIRDKIENKKKGDTSVK